MNSMTRYACVCNIGMNVLGVTDHFMVAFKAFSKGESICLVLKIWSRIIIEDLISPSGNPTSIIL